MTYLKAYLTKNPTADQRDLISGKCPGHFFKNAPLKEKNNDNCFLNSEDPGSSRDNPYDICLTCWFRELKEEE